jgi:hypothetical protein
MMHGQKPIKKLYSFVSEDPLKMASMYINMYNFHTCHELYFVNLLCFVLLRVFFFVDRAFIDLQASQ